MSKTCILCHIVFGTKKRERTIEPTRKRELYGYINQIIKNRKCQTLRINGMEDHIHILLDLHPSIALADLVKSIKQLSSNWLKENWIFPMFNGWASGYYASSVGIENKEIVRQYIINQEEHHRNKSFGAELEYEIRRHGLKWIEDDWQ